MGISFTRHQQNWEELASLDPYWAVVSLPEKRYGRWDRAEFFATGRAEIERLMGYAERLGYPRGRVAALDFGCGLGRLTRVLAMHFEMCWGVDISSTMIAQASRLSADVFNCQFVLNEHDHLKRFDTSFFDMIYCNLVLQHIQERAVIKRYISEFVRVLKPDGLLVFQLPSRIPLRRRLQPRRRLYALLRRLTFDARFLYCRLGLYPVRMGFIPQQEVIHLLDDLGARVLWVQTEAFAGPGADSKTFYVTKSETRVGSQG